MAQALSQYTMSIFKILVLICKAIEKKIANFWWRTSKKTTSLHQKKWESLKLWKDEWGLGFKDLGAFNKAMLEFLSNRKLFGVKL